MTFFFFAHLIVGAGAGSGQQKKTGSGKKKPGSGTYHLVIYIEIQYREDRRLLKKTKKFYIFRYRSHRVGLVALLFAKRIITREGKIRLRPMKAEPPPSTQRQPDNVPLNKKENRLLQDKCCRTHLQVNIVKTWTKNKKKKIRYENRPFNFSLVLNCSF